MPFGGSALPDTAPPGGFREVARFSALRGRGRGFGDLAWTGHTVLKEIRRQGTAAQLDRSSQPQTGNSWFMVRIPDLNNNYRDKYST